MKNIRRGLSFFIFIFLVSLSSAGQKIEVLSFNIRYASYDNPPQNWDQRKDGVISVMRGYDFIGLQEVVPVQMNEIGKSLENEYLYFFRTREADPKAGEGCPVLYNKARWEEIRNGTFWLSETPLTEGSNTWGAAFNRIVTFGFFRDRISGDSVLVINTHFDHISQSARENSISLILDRFQESFKIMPVVFMGDLNVTPENPVYKAIMKRGLLTDTYNKKHPKESVKGATFHGWKSDPPTERIDYIFASRFLKVKCSRVIHDKFHGYYPSDHFPVNSKLKL